MAAGLICLFLREDNVVFSLAHRLISTAEFDQLQARTAVAGIQMDGLHKGGAAFHRS